MDVEQQRIDGFVPGAKSFEPHATYTPGETVVSPLLTGLRFDGAEAFRHAV